MIFIDTEEKLQWLLEAFESDDFQVVSRKHTEEEWAEISRELAEYRAAHPKTPIHEENLPRSTRRKRPRFLKTP